MCLERTDKALMRHTLSLAAGALETGEFPIAAIVVLEDQVLGSGTASERREQRFLGHAELAALEQADRLGLSYAERRQCRLFTNLEPCLMCMGAAIELMRGREYKVVSARVLALAAASGCSAHDCEFVALAEDLDLLLITCDRQILDQFPSRAVALDSFVGP